MTEAERSRRRRRRVIRWVFFLVVFGALYYGVIRRVSLRRLDIATVEAMEPAMRRGALHLIDKSPSFALRRGWIVWWTYAEGSLFSRVAGVPGDVVSRTEERWAVHHPDGSFALLSPETRLGEGWDGRELRPEEHLLLNDRLEASWPDSRRVGPVVRSDILARVLFPLGDGQ